MESQFTFDFNPVSAIVADAVGRPGQRTFFLQARQGADMATLVMEKEQVAALATSILQLLEELEKERADLPAVEEEAAVPSLREPLEPAFRVGQLGLGYDERQDLMVLIAQAVPDPAEGEPDLPRRSAQSRIGRRPGRRSQGPLLCNAGTDALLERTCPAGRGRRPAGLPPVWARHRAGGALLPAHERPRISAVCLTCAV